LVTAQAGQRHLAARFVVDASGRASWFARRQSAQRINADGLVGLVALLSPPPAAPDAACTEKPAGKIDRDSLTMVEAVEDGWWYAALLADGNLVAAYLSDGDLTATKAARTGEGWLRLLGQTIHLSRRVAAHGYSIARGPRIVSANSSRLDCVAGTGWVAVGDAAMAYDPLSSQGILAALETGAAAAAAIHAYLQGDGSRLLHYEQSINERWMIYLNSLRFFYAQERRWPGSNFWQRRLAL
jgi:flavin-dependent dehydrogenase